MSSETEVCVRCNMTFTSIENFDLGCGVQFARNGDVIISKDGNKNFPSINAAKRRSREIQLANGGLGRGVLIVA